LELILEICIWFVKFLRPHIGRGRKIQAGQKVHSTVVFTPEAYRPKAILPKARSWDELERKGSPSSREWREINEWDGLIEKDIYDLSQMPTVINSLKSGTGSETSMWVYRLETMTLTGGHFFDCWNERI
jgi:hypothetical protein